MSEVIKNYVSIDLETTGLNPKKDKIIEIGAVKVDNGVVSDMFSSFVNPGRKLEECIIELTGIHDEDVETAPYIEDVLPQLLEFAGEYPLLGHRILFDYSFIKKAAVDNKFTFEKNGIDTLKIARKYLDKLEHRNLDYLCVYYEIPHHAHRALEDAKAAHLLYGKLVEQFFDDSDSLFAPSPLVFKIKKDTPASNKQKERLYRLIELHKIIPEADVEHLSKSEADRLIDKILASYGR